MKINPTPVATDETRTYAFTVTDGPTVNDTVMVSTCTVTVVRTDSSPWRLDGIELSGPRVDGGSQSGRLTWDGRNVRHAPDWARTFAMGVAVTVNVENDRPRVGVSRTMTATATGPGSVTAQAGRDAHVSHATATTVSNTIGPGARVQGVAVQAGSLGRVTVNGHRVDHGVPDFGGGYGADPQGFSFGTDASDLRH